MKTVPYLCLALCLLAPLGAAQFNDPAYLTSGYVDNKSASYARGLWVIDARTQTAVSLFPPTLRPYYIYSAMMDADNRSIIFSASTTASTLYNPRNGLFRYNPVTGVLQTLEQGTYNKAGERHQYTYRALEMTQDGDYVFGMWGATQTVPTTVNDYQLVRTDGRGNRKVLSYSRIGTAGISAHDAAIGRSIDSGRLLVQTRSTNSSSLYNWYYGVLEVDTDGSGKWATFSNGGGYYYPKNQTSTRGYGWYQNYGRLHQDYRSGALTGVESSTAYIYKLMPGQTPRNTLYLAGRPAGWTYRSYAPGIPDLQSAPKPRWVVPAYWYKPTQGSSSYAYTPGAIAIDQQSFFATGIPCDPTNKAKTRYGATYYPYVWDFYRGRHIQTVKTGANKWQVRFSCPSYPNMRYAAAISASGVRPGIVLPDGRTVFLNYDGLLLLSIAGALNPFFSAGPLTLDKNGEAQGAIDLSSLGSTGGTTIHIGMVVIDVKAPTGIAFIPDSQVLRIP